MQAMSLQAVRHLLSELCSKTRYYCLKRNLKHCISFRTTMQRLIQYVLFCGEGVVASIFGRLESHPGEPGQFGGVDKPLSSQWHCQTTAVTYYNELFLDVDKMKVPFFLVCN